MDGGQLEVEHVEQEHGESPDERRRGRLIAAIVVLAAAVIGAAVVWFTRDPSPPSLELENVQTTYVASSPATFTSAVDLRLRNTGGQASQIHRLVISVERLAKAPYAPCAAECLPRVGPQSTSIYSIDLTGAQQGDVIARDIGQIVKPFHVDRIILAFGTREPGTALVARLRIQFEADSDALTSGRADILVLTGRGSETGRRLTERQLELALEGSVRPVLTGDDIRLELTGRGLPVPPWLGEAP